jgi:hypothetical protein
MEKVREKSKKTPLGNNNKKISRNTALNSVQVKN